ncbi:hypothetical protein [Vibrio cholerae]|uniref:hypothetical protein n=1 Tax=Vibrio cholerae TaxID=666 RepID=UPI00307FD9B2
MAIISKKSYRHILIEAKDNRWFWPSYITSVVLVILIPIMKGWGNFDTMSMMFLMLANFGMCVLLASEGHLYKFNIGTAVIFMSLTWLNSSPTEGIGTYFYTEAQIERFKQVEEMRRELSGYSQLKFSELKPNLPENFSSEFVISEDNGKLEIQVKNQPKDVEATK